MEQCSTHTIVKSSRAYDERVRYWHKKKGLSLEEATMMASRKDDMQKLPVRSIKTFMRPRLQTKPKLRPVVAKPDYSTFTPTEPTDEQVQEVLSKLYETGQATLLNSSGQVVRPEQFKSPANQQSRDAEEIRKLITLGFPAIVVAASSSLLISASIKALGFTIEGVTTAILLEIGILTLAIARAQSRLMGLLFRLGALALVILSFFLLHTTANHEHHSRIAQVTGTDSRVASLEATKKVLIAKLDQLPATHRTSTNELLSQINANDLKIEAARKAVEGAGKVEVLEHQFWVQTALRLALLALNVFFAHRFIAQLRSEGILS